MAAWAGVGVSIAVAAVSLAHSSKANRHSDEALALAKSAEERADRLERISTERRDVAWEFLDADDDPNSLSLRNTGTDIAYDVQLILDPTDGERHSIGAEQVLPREILTLDITDLTAEAERQWEDYSNSGYIGTPGFVATARMSWRSETGVPDVRTWEDLRLG